MTYSECRCGCGKFGKGRFLPGHDQKLRAQLERRTGGILGLERLVDAAQGFAHDKVDRVSLEKTVGDIFSLAPPS